MIRGEYGVVFGRGKGSEAWEGRDGRADVKRKGVSAVYEEDCEFVKRRQKRSWRFCFKGPKLNFFMSLLVAVRAT